jgi:hypothetical protein
MDQIRADVFIDLLLGESDGNGRQGGVEITVDLKTLADLSESPGELAGYGPVIADIARQVAHEQRDTQWRTRVVDDNGQIIHTGTTRRRPDARLKREILASYPTCAFPGCRMPATDCDIDHRDPWSKGGDTSFENNAPLCRHDHVGRHKAGWEYVPATGRSTPVDQSSRSHLPHRRATTLILDSPGMFAENLVDGSSRHFG